MIDELSAKISGIGTVPVLSSLVCRYVVGGLGDLLYPLTVEYRGAASSESAAGAPGPRLFLRLLSRPRFRPSRGRVVGGGWSLVSPVARWVVLVRVCRWVWMVVRFVCVICVTTAALRDDCVVGRGRSEVIQVCPVRG